MFCLQAGSAVPWIGMAKQAGEMASNLIVNPMAQKLLENNAQGRKAANQQQPLNLICVLGAKQQGKSFLLNVLSGSENL